MCFFQNGAFSIKKTETKKKHLGAKAEIFERRVTCQVFKDFFLLLLQKYYKSNYTRCDTYANFMSSGRCGVNVTYPENELIVIKVSIYLHSNILTTCL